MRINIDQIPNTPSDMRHLAQQIRDYAIPTQDPVVNILVMLLEMNASTLERVEELEKRLGR